MKSILGLYSGVFGISSVYHRGYIEIHRGRVGISIYIYTSIIISISISIYLHIKRGCYMDIQG